MDKFTLEEWAEDKQRFIQTVGQRLVPEARGTEAEGNGECFVGPLAREFEDLARSLFDASTIGGVLAHIVQAAQSVVIGADCTSITFSTADHDFTTLAQSDQLARTLDRLQYDLGEGPSLDATHTPGTGQAASSNLRRCRDWPRFGSAAADHGVHSVLAAGLFPYSDPPRLGALNCYSRYVNGLDAADANLALLLAAHASTAVAAAHALNEVDLENCHLRRALESRDVIGQAKGILMLRRNITADQAFEILRKASQDLNIKLAELARTLAEQRDKLL